MAFAKGNNSNDTISFSKYVGIGTVNVLAVNPNKNKLTEIYGRDYNDDPVYTGKIDNDFGSIKTAKIDFIIRTVPEKCNNIDFITKVTFFLRNEARYNKDNSKVQVIDKYGRTAWVTIEQSKAHEIPVYSNGPANIDKDYRPAFVGEEKLTNFLKKYLNIPNVMKYVNNTWVMVDNPEFCQARLENIKDYFDNNFSELNDIVSLQPTNAIKVLFGVRTADNNAQYQTVYTDNFLKPSMSTYDKFEEEVNYNTSNGMYANTEFKLSDESHITDIQEYIVKATDFNNLNQNNSDDDLPW